MHNHHADSIAQRCEQLCNKVYNLGELVTIRKTNFKDNADFLRFLWKADVIESWITYKDVKGIWILGVRGDEIW